LLLEGQISLRFDFSLIIVVAMHTQ